MNFVLVVVIQKLIKKQMTNCLLATAEHCVRISFVNLINSFWALNLDILAYSLA